MLTEVARVLPADRIDEALELVRDLNWEYGQQAEPLAALAAAALDSRADGEALLREAFDATLDLDSPDQCSWVLQRLAPVLPEAWVREALEATRSRLELGNQWACLTALAERLGVLGQWAAALEVARELREHPVWRVHGLLAVAPYGPEPEKSALVEEILEATQKLGRIDLTGELARVALCLTEPALRRALDWADSLEAKDRTAAVCVLLPRLADLGHGQEAYDRALGETAGVEAWGDLIPHLPEPHRAQACRRALRLATSIDDVRERLLACVSQAGALGDEAVADLLRSVEAIDGSTRDEALRTLMPHLPHLLLPQALEVALTVSATERFAGKALESPRAAMLAMLAPRLQGTLHNRALQAARTAVAEIEDADERDNATLRVAVAFSAPDMATADVREAVTRRIRDIGPWPWRKELVREFAPFLPADLVKEVEAKQQADDVRRAQRVNDLLTPDPGREGRGLEAGTLQAAFDEAQDIATRELRATALSRLAPHLTALLEWRDPDGTERTWIRSRAHVLETLAPHLSLDQLSDALSAALDLLIRDSTRSQIALASLAGPLGTLPRGRLHPLWRQTLHALAPLHRGQTLTHLGLLGPLATALGGQAAAHELVRAVGETGEWWP